MILWVAYDADGLPVAVFDSQYELAEYLGCSTRWVRKMIKAHNPRVAKVWDADEESQATDEKL